MDATAALRHDWFRKLHAKIKERVLTAVETFRKERGYAPPYWELVKLARQAASLG
jgi:hypothetical protein